MVVKKNIEIGNRLREFALDKFSSLSAFAEALEVKPQNLNAYLTGERVPGNTLQERLRNIGCNIEWLMTGKKSGVDEAMELFLVPFLGVVYATPDGIDTFDYDNIPSGAGVPFFKGNYFALEVRNDSMISATPEIYPGDICIFELGRQPKNGDIVAIQFKQSNERTVKILQHVSRDEVELRAANKFRNYPSRTVKKNLIASYGVFVTKFLYSEEIKHKLKLSKSKE